MVTVIFYEKPGCINNTKQKNLLQVAGHTIEARNLLTENWTVDRLEAFFGQRPIADCFNTSAPMIKLGEVLPSQLDRTTALQLMIQYPLLIRRPLIQSGDRYAIGFDIDEIESWLGLTPVQSDQQTICDELKQQDLQTCPRSAHGVFSAFT